jgi:hypothetical protein
MRSLTLESPIGKRAAGHLDDRVQRETLEGHQHAADLIPGERSAIDEEKRERPVCLGVALDDATEPVRLRKLPPVLGLMDVSGRLGDQCRDELLIVLDGLVRSITVSEHPIGSELRQLHQPEVTTVIRWCL